MAYRNQSANCGYNNQMQRNSMASAPVNPVVAPVQANSVCGAVTETDPLAGLPLAMAYVPWQRFQKLYPVREAFVHGTMFQELDFDFYGRRCK